MLAEALATVAVPSKSQSGILFVIELQSQASQIQNAEIAYYVDSSRRHSLRSRYHLSYTSESFSSSHIKAKLQRPQRWDCLLCFLLAEPVTEPVTEPLAEPVVEPVAEPIAEPIAESVPVAVSALSAGAPDVELSVLELDAKDVLLFVAVVLELKCLCPN